MTILTWPADVLEPSTFRPSLIANTQSGGKSPFDGTEQTLVLPGSRWAAELRWEGLLENEWRPLMAFLWSLNGAAWRFSWAFPTTRRGTQTGGRINGAGQSGLVLATDGWSGGGGYTVRQGDWIGWTDGTGRAALHHVTVDATSTGGVSLIVITPPLRRPPPDDASLVLDAPTAVWKLAGDGVPEPEISGAMIADITLQIEEAIW